jgi:hypothetical protein
LNESPLGDEVRFEDDIKEFNNKIARMILESVVREDLVEAARKFMTLTEYTDF